MWWGCWPILKKTNEAGIPVYGSEIEQMKVCGRCRLDHVQLGIQTGKMAAKILTGEANCQGPAL